MRERTYKEMDNKKSDTRQASGKRDKANAWENIKTPILYTVMGFALGGARLPFGALPFGFAALCAEGVKCIFVYIGLCISLLFAEQPLILLAAYTLCLGIRAVISLVGKGKKISIGALCGMIFREAPPMRTIGAAFGAFAWGLVRLIRSGFLYYDLFGALISILGAVLFALLWYFADSEKHGFLSSAAISTLVAACVWGLGDFSVYGISMSVFFCLLSSLVLSRYKGMRMGVLTALVSGLCVSFDLVPLFVFATVCYSLLSSVSAILGCITCIAVGLAWGIYMDGLGALTTLLPALLAASVLFLAICKIYAVARSPKQEKQTASSCADNEYLVRLELSELREKGKVLEKSLYELCELMSKTYARPIMRESLNDILKKAKYTGSGLTAEVGEIGVHEETKLSALRADSGDCLLAVSEYLGEALKQKREEYIFDAQLTDKLCHALNECDIGEIECMVLGESEKRAVFICDDAKKLEETSHTLCELTSKICGYTAHAASVKSVGERSYISISRGQLLRASMAGKKKNARGEKEFCGDSLGMLTKADSGQAAAFICDGMGSGKEAAQASGMCAVFLQKLLSMNMDKEGVRAAVDMTSAFLHRRNDTQHTECSCTLDICIVDLRSAKTCFYKCGAAPTYIFRDGSPFKLRSRTVPVGIMDKADIGYIDMELIAGDTIVMVSDGIGEDKTEFFDFLRDKLAVFNANQLAEAIIEYANKEGCEDDVSAVVIKIEDRGIGEML